MISDQRMGKKPQEIDGSKKCEKGLAEGNCGSPFQEKWERTSAIRNPEIAKKGVAETSVAGRQLRKEVELRKFVNMLKLIQ